MTLILALLLRIAPASAAEFSEAEHVRLSGDLELLTSRQLWAGAEKKYLELIEMEKDAGRAILTFEDLVFGAYAARALGHMLDVRDRLTRATLMEGPEERMKEVHDWLSSIRSTYGQVRLLAHNARNVEFAPELLPMDPDQRNAVELASDSIRKYGSFNGLLPRGDYSFAGHSFRVEPGVAVNIETSPRLRKTHGEVVRTAPDPMVDPGPSSGSP